LQQKPARLYQRAGFCLPARVFAVEIFLVRAL
jgi:hypothetical protein